MENYKKVSGYFLEAPGKSWRKMFHLAASFFLTGSRLL